MSLIDGQTGSGKTFTMEGYGDPGVTPRAMMELFRQVDALTGEWTYTLTLSILEIYNESIHDLLNNNPGKDKEKLDIRQTPDGNVVAGLTEVPVRSIASSSLVDVMILKWMLRRFRRWIK